MASALQGSGSTNYRGDQRMRAEEPSSTIVSLDDLRRRRGELFEELPEHLRVGDAAWLATKLLLRRDDGCHEFVTVPIKRLAKAHREKDLLIGATACRSRLDDRSYRLGTQLILPHRIGHSEVV
jgi:hypothetical protein